MADLFSPDEIAMLTGQQGAGMGLGGDPQGWQQQQGIPPDVLASDQSGNQTQPIQPSTTPAPTPAPAPAPPSPTTGLGGGGPWQSLAGLGLGMLAGNPFNKWGAAMQGYQRGAAADQAAAAQAETARYHQQQLQLHRDQMAQSERLANLTAEIKEYQFARSPSGGNFKGSFQDFLQARQELQNKQYGSVQQFWVPDPNAPGGYSLKMYQPTSRGGFVEAGGLPPGATPAQATRMVQTDQGMVPVPTRVPPPPPAGTPAAEGGGGPTTGAPIPGSGTAEKEAAKQRGTVAGKTQMGLPELESTTNRMLSRLDELEGHKNLGAATGYVYGKLPTSITSPDVGARIDEIQGQNWTLGIQAMRGMGALSDREGARIDQARSRLSRRDVSTEEYKKAISDLREVLQTGLENARKIASGKMKPYEPGDEPSGGGGGKASGTRDDPVRVRTPTEALKLGRGTWFVNPAGEVLQVP